MNCIPFTEENIVLGHILFWGQLNDSKTQPLKKYYYCANVHLGNLTAGLGLWGSFS